MLFTFIEAGLGLPGAEATVFAVAGFAGIFFPGAGFRLRGVSVFAKSVVFNWKQLGQS